MVKTKLRMRLEIKEISAEGSFEGMLSPYGNVDGGGDVVEPGAYAKTLKDQGNTRPMLWQHKTDVPIGDLTLEDRPDGLWAKGQLLMALPEAQKAYLLIKARIVKGLSIGFETIKDAVEGGIRHLKEIKLYEGSIVTFPMNEMALIVSVKRAGETKDDFNEELADIQLQDSGDQMFRALYWALGSLPWAPLAPAEKVSAAEAILQQFTDAYLAYLPAYVAYLEEEYGGMETMTAKRSLEIKATHELKAGAKWSAADKKTIQSHADAADGVAKGLRALVDDEAGKAATATAAGAATTLPEQAAETKSEPVEDHSALSELLIQAKESFQWNSKN